LQVALAILAAALVAAWAMSGKPDTRGVAPPLHDGRSSGSLSSGSMLRTIPARRNARVAA
jgi:hypothetical protein